MSSVDERIVEMKFENHLFEKNVNTSIETLEKLKSSLNFEGAGKSLGNIEKSVNGMDFSKISASLDSISHRFSNWGIVGMTVIQDLTRAAENLGKKMLDATVGQIKSGGWSRATNIDQAKFKLEGLHVAWEDIYDDIDYGVTQTAYGLDAAASAAAQLVASGVEYGKAFGETGNSPMAHALKAISGVASMTSSSYEEISSIFTTVAGQGKLMTMQLRQLESRGLNVAATMGQQLGYTEAEIREFVTDGKISFDIFADAMFEAFGEQAGKANETFEGSLSNMKSALSRIGQEFATPVRKYATDIFNSIRPVINAIKKEKLTPIFVAWESLARRISRIVTSFFNNLDLSILDSAVEKVTIFMESFRRALGWIGDFKNVINDVSREGGASLKAIEAAIVTAEQIDDIASKAMRGLFGNEADRDKAIDDYYNITGLFEVVENRISELNGEEKKYEKTLEQLNEDIQKNADAYKYADGTAMDYIRNLRNNSSVFSNVESIIEGLRDAIVFIGKTVGAVFSGAKEPTARFFKVILDLFGYIGNNVTLFREFAENSDFYGRVQDGVNKVLNKFVDLIEILAPYAKIAFDFIYDAIVLISDKLHKAKAKVDEFWDSFTQSTVYQTIKGTLETLSPYWDQAVDTANTVIDAAEQVIVTTEMIDELATKTIQGLFGNGEDRKNALEELMGIAGIYEVVQNRVNEMLGCSFRYDMTLEQLNANLAEQNANTEEQVTGTNLLKKAYNQAKDAANNVKSAMQGYNDSIEHNTAMNNLVDVIFGINAAFQTVKGVILSVISGAMEPLTRIGKIVGRALLGIGGAIGRALVKFATWMKESGAYEKIQVAVNNLLNKFADILARVVNIGGKVFNKLGEIFLKVWDYISALKDKVVEFWDAFKKTEGYNRLSEVFGGIKDQVIELKDSVFGGLQETIEKFLGSDVSMPEFDAKDFATTVSDTIVWVLDKINEIKEGISSFFDAHTGEGSIFSNIVNFFKDFTISDAITNFTTLINNATTAVSDFFSSFADNITSGFTTFISWINEFLDSMRSGAGKAAEEGSGAISGYVKDVKKALPGFEEIKEFLIKVVKWVTGANFVRGINGFARAFWYISSVIKQFAGTIRQVKLYVRSLKQVNKGAGRLMSATAILEIAAAVGILALAFKGLANLSWDEVKVAGGAIAIITAALAVLFAVIGHFSRKKNAVSTPLESLAQVLNGFTFNIKKSLRRMGAAAEIMALVLGIRIIIGVIQEIAQLPYSDIKKGVKVIGLIMAEIVGAMVILGLIGNGGSKESSKSKFRGGSLFQDSKKSSKSKSKNGGGFVGKAVAMVAIAAAVRIAAGAITSLGSMNPESLDRGIDAIKSIMFGMTEIIAASALGAKVKSSTKPMIAAIVALVAVVGAIIALSFLQRTDITVISGALDTVFTVLSLFMISLSRIFKYAGKGDWKNTLASFGGIALILGALGLVFYLIQSVDAEAMVKQAGALRDALIGLGILVAAMGFMNTGDFKAGLAGALSVGELIVVIGIIALVAGFINKHCPAFETALTAGIPLMEKLGEAIGALIGGLLSRLLGPLAEFLGSKLADMGNSLTSWLQDLMPFFSGAEGVTDAGMKNIKDILLLLVEITGAEILGAIGTAFVGDSGLNRLAEHMVTFANKIVEYSDIVKGKVDEEAVAASTRAGEMITALADTIPNSGGLAGIFAGNNDLDDFSEMLDDFGNAIVNYSAIITGEDGKCKVDEEAVKASANAGTMLADLAAKIPNTGGGLSFLIGDNKLSDFAKELEPFADAIVKYSAKITGKDGKCKVNEEAVKASANAGSMIASFAKKIPNTGGKLAKWIGDNTMSEFAKQMLEFAPAIVDYSSIVEGNVNEEAVAASARAATLLAEFNDAIPDTGGLLTILFGDNDISTFGEKLVEFGSSLVEFSNVTSYVDLEPGLIATQAVGDLCKALDVLSADAGTTQIDQAEVKLVELESLIAGVFTMFARALEEFEDKDTIAQVAAVIADIEDILGQLSNISPDAEGEFRKGFLDIVSSENLVRDINKKAKEIIGTYIDKAKEKFTDYFPTLHNSFLEGYRNISIEVTKNLLSNFDVMAAIVKVCMQSIIKTISGFSWPLNMVIKGMCQKAVEIISSYEDTFKDAGGQLLAGFMKGLNSKKANKDVENATISVAKSAIAGIVDTLSIHSPSRVGEYLGQMLLQGFTDGLSDEASMVYTVVSKVGGYVSDKWKSSTVSEAEEAGTEVAQVFNSSVSNNLLDNASSILGGFSLDSFGDYTDALIQYANVDSLSSLAGEVGIDFNSGLASSLLGNSGIALDAMGEFSESLTAFGIGEITGYALPETLTAISEGGNNIIAEIQDIATRVNYSAVVGAGTVLDFMHSAESQFEEAGKNEAISVESGFAHGMKLSLPKIEGTFNNVKKKILSYLSQIADVCYDSGKDIGVNVEKGMAHGMISKEQELINTTSRVATSVITAISNRLQVKSPSRVMMWIGEMVDKGLAKGITNNLRTIDGAANDAAGSLTDNFTNIIDQSTLKEFTDSLVAAYLYINQIVSDSMNTNPVITPVLDLSMLQNGIGSMNGMMTGATLGVNSLSYANALFPSANLNVSSADIQAEMIGIRQDLKNLGEAVSNMKIIMDSGVVAGEVSSGVDRNLGRTMMLKERWA